MASVLTWLPLSTHRIYCTNLELDLFERTYQDRRPASIKSPLPKIKTCHRGHQVRALTRGKKSIRTAQGRAHNNHRFDNKGTDVSRERQCQSVDEASRWNPILGTIHFRSRGVCPRAFVGRGSCMLVRVGTRRKCVGLEEEQELGGIRANWYRYY